MNLLKTIGLALLFVACTKHQNASSVDAKSNLEIADMAISIAEQPIPSNGHPSETQASQKIIKTAQLSITTKNFKESEDRLNRLINQFKVLVQERNTKEESGVKYGTYIFRVDASNLEVFLDSLRLTGVEITQDVMKSEDVSADFTDTELRVKTKRAIYAQYLALISSAKNVEEVLKVQESARVLQEEIETMEGHLKLLLNQSTYSTIHFQLGEAPAEHVVASGFWLDVKNEFLSGFNALKEIFLSLIGAWPLLTIILGIFLGRKRIKRFFVAKWNPAISISEKQA